jgi:hypothetical protein
MFKRYLNYEFQNIKYQVDNRFSLAEFAWDILYEQNCIVYKCVFDYIKCSKKIPYRIIGI